MNIIEKYRLYKVNKMTNESFLRSLRRPGDVDDMLNIIQWFSSKWGCTSSQLSALCYYSYVWGLIFLRKEIAPFSFSKTEDGPIDERITNIYGLSDKIITNGRPPALEKELEKLLTLIWEKYSRYDGLYLMERAKNHYPYLEADTKLSAKDIFLFYSWVGLL